jgi:hypothetical protein
MVFKSPGVCLHVVIVQQKTHWDKWMPGKWTSENVLERIRLTEIRNMKIETEVLKNARQKKHDIHREIAR